MLRYRCIVVKQQLLPVGSKALNGIAVGIGKVVRIGIQWSLSAVNVFLVLQNSIISSTCNVALLPCALPSIAEVVVNLGLTHLTLLCGNQDNSVSSAGSVDGTRSSILQHLDTLDIVGVNTLQTVLICWHTVDDVQRIGIINSTCTAHANH